MAVGWTHTAPEQDVYQRWTPAAERGHLARKWI